MRIVGLGGAQESLQRNQRSSDSQGRGPLVLQNIETNGSISTTDIWMPDLSNEFHDRRLERVLLRDVDINIKSSVLIHSIFWSENLSLPVAEIVVNGGSFNNFLFRISCFGSFLQLFEFFHNSTVIAHFL